MPDSVEVHTEQHTLSPDNDSISFIAYVDGRKVDCVITGAALAHFPGGDKPIGEVFDANRDTIGSIAEFLISGGHRHVDGMMLIRPEDVEHYPGGN